MKMQIRKNSKILTALSAIMLFALPVIPISSAQAACSNPTGEEGEQIYNVDHSVMQYCDGTDWTAMRDATGTSGSTIIDGWPDAIVCEHNSTSQVEVLYNTHAPYSDGLYWYENLNNPFYLRLNSDGTYNSNTGLGSFNCISQTLSQLYASEQAFNFVGGGSGSSSASSTFRDGWPDVIRCNEGSQEYYLYYRTENPGSNETRYGVPSVGSSTRLTFNTDTKTYKNKDNISGTASCLRDIADYIADDDAFYFGGGPGGGSSYTESTAVSFGAGATWAHGMAAIPDRFGAYLQAKTANNGYSIGDRIPLVGFDGDGGRQTSLFATTTNITFNMRSSLFFADASGNGNFTADSTNWELIFWTSNGGGSSGGSADDLGDHTATQNLDMAAFKLVGNGGTTGFSIQSSGQVNFDNIVSVNTILKVASSGNAAAPSIQLASDLGLFRPTGSQLGFSTSGTERMRIDASGNVGVGTSAPVGPLHIGTVIDAGPNSNTDSASLIIGDYAGRHLQFDDNEISQMTDASTAGRMSLQADGGGLIIHGNEAGGTHFEIDSNGNVAIGTAIINNTRLKLTHNGGHVMELGSNTTLGSDIYMSAAGTITSGDGMTLIMDGEKDSASNTIRFARDGLFNTDPDLVELMKINEAGQVSVGSDFDGKFTITGAPDISGANSVGEGSIVIQNSVDNASSYKMRIDANEIQVSEDGVAASLLLNAFGGNVIIGTHSAGGTSNLDMNGNFIYDIGAPVSSTYAATKGYVDTAVSDRRLKKNIKSFQDNGLETILKLRPVTYDWINPTDNVTAGTQYGFIAQEVGDVLPDLIITKEDDMKTQSYTHRELIPFLTKAIQELKLENDNLKKRLEKLENQD